jgi:mono/diheme cytochrome c family protein
MNQRLFFLLVVAALTLAACGGGDGSGEVAYPIKPDPAGESLYAENCQVCHASPVTGGERQFDAPRHDADGHTWHHADRPLVEWVLDGVPGGSGAMPEFRDTLSEAEVALAIAYIKSTWAVELQAWQTENSQAWEDQLAE